METKYCSRGEHDVPRSDFRVRSAAKDGLQAWCKPCLKQYEKERWSSGIDLPRKRRNTKASFERGQSYVWGILTKSSCLDCGDDDPLILEFDHRPGVEKMGNISEMLSLSIARIQKEIDKCDIRCANCHKKKTAKDFGFWRSLR